MNILKCFLPAIFNDDCSGLNDSEIALVQKFVDTHAGCIFDFKDTETNFKKCDLSNLAGDCVELTVTRPHFKTRFINCRRAGHPSEYKRMAAKVKAVLKELFVFKRKLVRINHV